MSSEKIREELKLTEEEAREIVYNESDYFSIISDTITGTGRWSIYNEIIVKRVADNKYFITKHKIEDPRSEYSVGATEGQDESSYENSDLIFIEVFPIEKTVTVYE